MCRNCVDGICQNKCVLLEPTKVNYIGTKPKANSHENAKGSMIKCTVKVRY